MAESEISARLRRLREEGEKEGSIWKPSRTALPLPSGMDPKTMDFRPVDVTHEVVVEDEEGLRVEQHVSSTVADVNAGPFENIVHRGWIRRRDEDEEMAGVRTKTALRFRSLYEGAQVTPLKGQGYDGGGAGRGGTPRPVADHAIDCQKYLGSLMKRVPEDAYKAVVDVVGKDIWIWEGKSGGAITKEVDRVLRGLDHLAVAFGYLTKAAVEQRWPATRPRRAKDGDQQPAQAAS